MNKTDNIKTQEVVQCINYLEANLPAEEAIVIPASIFQHIKETIIMMEDKVPYKKNNKK